MINQIDHPGVERHWYKRPLLWAFMLLFVLISFLSFVSYFSFVKIEEDYLYESRNHIEKLRLLDDMVHYSRQRAVLLRDLVITDDPFFQDELIQRHMSLATRYLRARNDLSRSKLSSEEKSIIDRIIGLNSSGYELQQNILELAVNGERDKALELISNELSPNREQIYPLMLDMKRMLVSDSETQSQHTIQLTRASENTILWLYVAAVLLGTAIVYVAFRLERRYSDQLNWQATHDVLTGLANRFYFEQHLSKTIASLSNTSLQAVQMYPSVLIYIDIDQFNLINNASGNDAGDELLRHVSSQIVSVFKESAFIARVGGDQFAVLLDNTTKDEAVIHSKELAKLINEKQFLWMDRSYVVTISVGIVPFSKNDSMPVSDLLTAAYVSCDLAKEAGGGHIEVYDKDKLQTQDRREQLNWASRLKQAMSDRKLVLFRQGIHTGEGDIAHNEILLRMESEAGEIISAGHFIPAAERYNLIMDIDLYVVRGVLEHMSNSVNEEHFSINISGVSLGSSTFANQIIDLVNEYEVDPERICFEVTETAAIMNKTTAIRFMNILHGIGCRFFLDDFGSGLSSFGYLRSLPIDIVKIDNAFTRNMEDDPANLAVIRSINLIAHGFGLKTIAEGVETQEQMSELKKLGVDYFQGYYLERPSRLMAA